MKSATVRLNLREIEILLKSLPAVLFSSVGIRLRQKLMTLQEQIGRGERRKKST